MTFHAFLTQKYPLYADTEIKVNLTVQQLIELNEEFVNSPMFEVKVIDRVIGIDKIKCPNCGKVQDAEVTQHLNAPFATYIKNCECGYTIMESEWDVI